MNVDPDADVAIGTRRQRIVLLLHEMDTPVTIDELVDALEADPRAHSDAPGTPTTWDDFHRELYEFDLPALDDVGLVQFDPERGVVSDPTESPTDTVLSTTPGDDADPSADGGDASRPWAAYYLALVVLAAAAVALVRLGVGPLRGVPSLLLVGAVLGLFTVLSLVHFAAT